MSKNETVVETETQEVAFWTCDKRAETLTCQSIEEAIGEFIEENEIDPEDLDDTITVYGFSPLAKPTAEDNEDKADWLLDMLLEDLDATLGAPNNVTEPTPEMKLAALAFVSAIVNEFEVSIVEPVTEKEVSLAGIKKALLEESADEEAMHNCEETSDGD